jgi:hypothetical protein
MDSGGRPGFAQPTAIGAHALSVAKRAGFRCESRALSPSQTLRTLIRVVIGFDLTSWYGAIAAIAAVLVFWGAVVERGHQLSRWIKARTFPEAPKAPIVVLGAVGFGYNAVPLHERRIEQARLLTRLSAAFLIENKEAGVTVTKVEAGVRRIKDGREQRFEAFNAPALAPLEKAPVSGFELDPAMFEGLVESDFQAAFVWWARFTAPDGTRWEIAYDGAQNEYLDPKIVAAP